MELSGFNHATDAILVTLSEAFPIPQTIDFETLFPLASELDDTEYALSKEQHSGSRLFLLEEGFIRKGHNKNMYQLTSKGLSIFNVIMTSNPNNLLSISKVQAVRAI